MRRSELLGPRWTDIDLDKATVSINRGLVAIGYELTESRRKTANSRRSIDLDRTTVEILTAWKNWTTVERRVSGVESDRVFSTADGGPVHPHSISQAFERVTRNAGLLVIRYHDLRHTHATLLTKEGVPVKVVSERFGHAATAFIIDTYQHVLPGMQADAANLFAALVDPSTDEGRAGGSPGRSRPENRKPWRKRCCDQGFWCRNRMPNPSRPSGYEPDDQGSPAAPAHPDLGQRRQACLDESAIETESLGGLVQV